MTTSTIEQNSKSLEQQFRALSKQCVAAFDAHSAAENSASEKLVKAYLFFREIRHHQTFMAKLHQLEGIPLSDYLAAEPDFVPFVKIIFRIGLNRTDEDKRRLAASNSGTRRNIQTRYVAAIERLHVEYEGHEQRYRNNPLSGLLDFHAKNGGIAAATEWRAEANKRGQFEQAEGSKPVARNARMGLADVARTWVSANAFPIISKSGVKFRGHWEALGAFEFDSNGNALVAVTRHGRKIVHVANDDLHQVVANSAKRLKHIDQPVLRTLAEIVRTQLYPKQFAPSGSRTDMASDYRRWELKLLGSKARRHILVTANKIILSTAGQKSGLVTELEPAKNILPQAFILLRSRETTLHLLEDLIDAKALCGCEIGPDELRGLAGNAAAGVMLRARRSSGEAATPQKLMFDDASQSDNCNDQPSLGLSTFKPDWSFSMSPLWAKSVWATYLTPWFKNQGAHNRVLRPINQRFNLTVDRHSLTIGYEIDATGNCPAWPVALGGDYLSQRPKFASNGPHSIDVQSTDLVRVFYALLDLPVNGRILVQGSNHLVLVSFETDMGIYKIGIPAVSESAKGLVADAHNMVAI